MTEPGGGLPRLREGREHFIDWLRLGATGAVFLFHTARFFNNDDWHVKNALLTEGFDIFVGVIGQWLMPLFFVLSGVSARLALGGQTGRAYLRSKVTRLLIPLVFGILVLSPHQIYLERLTHGQFQGSLLAFIPHYFRGFYGFGGNFAWMGMHLWYLLVLFAFSCVTLPLFQWLQGERGRALVEGMARLFSGPGLFLLLVVPIALLEMWLDPSGAGDRRLGGWSIFLYLLFFVCGYTVFGSASFKEATRRQWPVAGALAIAIPVVVLLTGVDEAIGAYRSPGYNAMTILRGINAVCWLVAFWGLGAKYLNFTNEFLRMASEAALPFYMLHQAVLVAVGFFVVQWPAGTIAKYGVIGAISLAIILALYKGVVEPFDAVRYLFGMKTRRNARATDVPARGAR